MLREEIARIEEMIDEKLVDFKAKLIAEFGPPPERATKPEPAAPAKKEPVKNEAPEKKVEAKK
jgi:hypothetical protein